MTKNEAIEELKILKEDYWNDDGYGHETKQYDDTMLALDMAIKALEQEPCEDAISRADAVKVASGYCHPSNIAKELAKLPPVQPEIIRCKDCKWKNNHNCTRAVELWIDDDKFCAWAERRTDG